MWPDFLFQIVLFTMRKFLSFDHTIRTEAVLGRLIYYGIYAQIVLPEDRMR
jgi:hypothetical protein